MDRDMERDESMSSHARPRSQQQLAASAMERFWRLGDHVFGRCCAASVEHVSCTISQSLCAFSSRLIHASLRRFSAPLLRPECARVDKLPTAAPCGSFACGTAGIYCVRFAALGRHAPLGNLEALDPVASPHYNNNPHSNENDA
jgi:hypothetical protein